MRIETPQVIHSQEDYDITFSSGGSISLTIDPAKGDTIVFGDKLTIITLTAKSTLSDLETTLPAETITIYTSHIVAVRHISRKTIALTPEERFELTKTINKTIN